MSLESRAASLSVISEAKTDASDTASSLSNADRKSRPSDSSTSRQPSLSPHSEQAEEEEDGEGDEYEEEEEGDESEEESDDNDGARNLHAKPRSVPPAGSQQQPQASPSDGATFQPFTSLAESSPVSRITLQKSQQSRKLLGLSLPPLFQALERFDLYETTSVSRSLHTKHCSLAVLLHSTDSSLLS